MRIESYRRTECQGTDCYVRDCDADREGHGLRIAYGGRARSERRYA